MMNLLRGIGYVLREFLALIAGVFFLAALAGLVIILVGLTSGALLVAGLLMVGAVFLMGVSLCVALLRDREM
jgi:hypothetical protein